MPGYRARLQQPIKTIKHVVDTNGGVTAALASITDLIDTVDNPARTSPNNVGNGSRVNAVYLNVQVIQNTPAGGIDNIYLGVFKNPGANLTPPALDQVGTSDNRKWMIHQEMVMTGNFTTVASAIPKTLFKGVIMIPRPYRRFGIDDKLVCILQHRTGEATQDTNFCLQCVYKEWR